MSSVVIGAGLVGAALVRELVARGEEVTVASRAGTVLPGAASVAVDAKDAAALARVTASATTVFLCTNPPYHRWTRDWPPVGEAVARAAAGKDLVAMGNLYSYGRAAMPMTEHSPELTTETKGLVRKALWASFRAAHERGDLRAVEVRASDYVGPGATATAHLGARFFVPAIAGQRVNVVGDPAAAHGWAYLPDIARTLAAASAFRGDWGRVWHVPSASDANRVQIAAWIGERYGTTPTVRGYPDALLRSLGWFSPMMREVHASSYQFTAPFVSDATETRRELGVEPTAWDEVLEITAASYAQ
jgi:nucleoside-diphosphate-sugar epimerase